MNEGQRRIIEKTLSLLDEVLCEFDEWAKGRKNHSVLYREQNTLSVIQRNEWEKRFVLPLVTQCFHMLPRE